MYSCSGESLTPEQQAEKNCTDEFGAYVTAHTFVKRHLKSPSTADFVGSIGHGATANYIGECTFIVSGQVDSQNGFGAVVRSTYSVELTYNKSSDNYTLNNILIE